MRKHPDKDIRASSASKAMFRPAEGTSAANNGRLADILSSSAPVAFEDALGRPFTVDAMNPQPPHENKSSRYIKSNRSINPRQIVIAFKEDNAGIIETEDFNQPKPPASRSALRPSTSGVSSRPKTVANTDKSIVKTKAVDPSTLGSVAASSATWSSVQVESMLPTFIKPIINKDNALGASKPISEAESTDNNRPMTTQYPSLSYRLQAKVGIDPAAKASMLLQGHIEQKTPQMKPSMKRKHQSNSNQNNDLESNLSLNSGTEFMNMTIEEALQYLIRAQESTGVSDLYVHVTSRSNVEVVNRSNFYDLVVLEKPGNPQSGYVWSREQGKYAFDDHVLPKDKVMQLSLHGLVMPSDPPEDPEVIPIPAFLKERKQFQFLRTGRFFGRFQEFKFFTAWVHFTRRSYVSRTKQLLINHSFFSDHELVNAYWDICEETYAIDIGTELFSFPSKGSTRVMDYFAAQMNKIEDVRRVLYDRIQVLGDKVAARYQAYLGSEKLKEMVQDIKDHHPLHETIAQTENSVDWIELRSIQRLGDNFKEKVKKLLYMAQYRIEYKLACILERFWLRIKQFSVGIHYKGANRMMSSTNYWDVDYSLFDSSGRFTLHAFSANENIHTSVEDEASAMMPEKPSKVIGDLELPFKVHAGKDIKRVAPEWENMGHHLSVEVVLYNGDTELQVSDLVNLHTSDNIRVQVVPPKATMLNQLHTICGCLGNAFESLPNLKKHSLIHQFAHPINRAEQELELGLGELHNPQSSKYFTFLIMFPVYNSRFGYSLAIETMRHFLDAYVEAASMESQFFKLFEIFKKLLSLSPTSLVKQIDRSFSLTKIKDFIEEPDMIEDLRRSQHRDKTRLITFKNGAVYLDNLVTILEAYSNIKNRLGLITSFRPIIDQLNCYRSIQYFFLYTRLPNSFVFRCSLFYDFLRKLEGYFGNQTKLLADDIIIMQRIKNFEMVREFYDTEIYICDTIYAFIEGFNSKVNASGLTAQELFIQKKYFSRTRSQAPALSPEKLFKVYYEAIDRVASILGQVRSNLLARLSDMRTELMMNKDSLHKRIASTSDSFEGFNIMDPEKNYTDINEVISGTGKTVDSLKKAVEESISGQVILSEAHDIVGAANPIMSSNEVDLYSDMENLGTLFSNRCNAWKILTELDAIRRQAVSSKLSNNNIVDIYMRFSKTQKNFDILSAKLEDQQLLSYLKSQIDEVLPKVELVSFLSSKALRFRHWRWINKSVFHGQGLDLRFAGRQSEIVTVMDISSREPFSLGNITRLVAGELFNRGVEKGLGKIRYMTSNAVMDSFLEQMLDTVDATMHKATAQLSPAWLNDSRLRDKVEIDLSEVTNLVPLRVMSRYCWKAILMVEATAHDMSLSTFDIRIEQSKDIVSKVDRFIENMQDSQYLFLYLLHFLKLLPKGELDRDSIRLFNNFTEDIKKIEYQLNQKSGNILNAFSASAEHDLNTESIKTGLLSVAEDLHSTVQSLLDACPRLSLLSYNKLVSLLKAWLLGPHLDLAFISDCFRDMFEGVGQLVSAISVQAKSFVCTGFHSTNKLEFVTFADPISFHYPLDEFVKRFENNLRCAVEKSCDMIVLHRINCVKSLLTNQEIEVIVENIHALFSVRYQQITSMVHNDYICSTLLLANYVSFAEDVWTCLGHPSGCITVAQPRLIIETIKFSKVWHASLKSLLLCIKENIKSMQNWLLDPIAFPRTSHNKSIALISAMFLQEVGFLQCIEEILLCSCLESAVESWAGRYQLRFEYEKDRRYRNSPIDIVMGNITVPYGLEYIEGGAVVMGSKEIEYAIARVLSSAFCYRGTTFITSTNNTLLIDNKEEIKVSGKDIAAALGRVYTTTTNIINAQSAKFFFSRLIYLDAIGCIDFRSIDQNNLQILAKIAQSFWSAMDSRNDQYMQDSLKYPLKAKFTRNDIHTDRRKSNITDLRASIDKKKKAQYNMGLIFIGFASEKEFTSFSAFDHINRSIFDSVSINCSRPIDRIGVLLGSKGFLYGAELQSALQLSLSVIIKKFESIKSSFVGAAPAPASAGPVLTMGTAGSTASSASPAGVESLSSVEAGLELMAKLCSNREINLLVSNCSTSMNLYKESKFCHKESLSKVDRLKLEIECFCENLWDRLTILSCGRKGALSLLQKDFFKPFIQRIEGVDMATESEIKDILSISDSDTPAIGSKINRMLIETSQERGLLCSYSYIQSCALLWNSILNDSSPILMLYGDKGIGKTSMLEAVVATMEKVQYNRFVFNCLCWPVVIRNSAKLIFSKIRAWVVRKATSNNSKAAKFEPVNGNNDSPQRESGGSKSTERSPSSSPNNRSKTVHPSKDTSSVNKMSGSTVCTIFHASLSLDVLIGYFDPQGRWLDGLLLRKLRQSSESYCSNLRNSSPNNAELSAYPSNIIVLDGPVGYQIEQLLHSLFFAAYSSFYASYDGGASCCTLSFPSGESFSLPSNTKIILVSSNIENASPSCLSVFPVQTITLSIEDAMKRMITLWTRSIIHWLTDFPPWLDFIEKLNRLLMSTKFVEDLLFDDFNAPKPSLATILAKVSAFLRLLEELLLQCQELALVHATFTVPEERDYSSESESESNNNQSGEDEDTNVYLAAEAKVNAISNSQALIKYKGIMSLNTRYREQLNTRARLSVVYAATWGLGGSLNNSDKRKVFDSMIRDSIYQFFDDSDLPLDSDCSVFDCVLLLDECTMYEALQAGHKSKALIAESKLSDKINEQNVFCDLIKGSDFASDRLIFRTVGNRAIFAAMRYLLSAGANVLLFGSKSSGKTTIISELLEDLRSACPTPDDMRQQVVSNVVNIINGATKPEGIFHAFDIIKNILMKIGKAENKGDLTDDFNTYWRSASKTLQSISSGKVRNHMKSKSVSSSSTSLRGCTTAKSLRSWFEREYATETANVLETPRFTCGLAFLDDMHYLTPSDNTKITKNEPSNHLNRVEEVLRGILDKFPSFSIRRNTKVKSSAQYGYHFGSVDTAFSTAEQEAVPILHREQNSDLRFMLSTTDNFMLQRIGLVSAATGQASDVLKSDAVQSIVTKFSLISLAALTSQEIHAALVTGAFTCLSSVAINLNILELLKSEITDLSKITLHVMSKVVSTADYALTTPLERIMRSSIMLNISLLAKFCLSLGYGGSCISNPGCLLQLYAHEWKRTLLDPLPSGAQRDRVIGLLGDQLEQLDDEKWCLSRDWIITLKEEIAANTDRVWSHSKYLTPPTDPQQGEHSVPSEYVPLELEYKFMERFIHNGTYDYKSQEFRPALSNAEIFDGQSYKVVNLGKDTNAREVATLIYPAALSLVLRIVRLLSLGSKHLLLVSYPGSTSCLAIQLAAKICNLETKSFTNKETDGIIDTPTSERSKFSSSFENYMKAIVLKAAGLSDPITANDAHDNPNSVSFIVAGKVVFTLVEPLKVLSLIDGAQQLNANDRRILLYLIDYTDPSILFSDAEIQGISDVWRKQHKEAETKQNNITDIEIVSNDNTYSRRRSSFIATRKLDLENIERSKENEVTDEGEETNTMSQKEDDRPAVGVASSFQSKVNLSGYTFQWVKRRLQTAFKTNIFIAINMELSSVLELDPKLFTSKQEALSALKKMVGTTNARRPERVSKAVSSRASTKRATKDLGARRYSVLASRQGADLANEDISIYNPVQDQVKLADDSSQNNQDASMIVDPSITAAAEKALLVSANGLFTCPILGPILSRKFAWIWYGINNLDATQGICNVLMRNENLFTTDSNHKMPLVLSLKSSNIGNYKVSPMLGSGISNAVANSSKPKRLSESEIEEQRELELRRIRFTSGDKIQSFHLIIEANAALFKKIQVFSILEHLGIFKSYAFSTQFQSYELGGVEHSMAQYVEEARNLLPYLLTTPLPIDAIFLTESIYSPSVEFIARHASDLVMYLLYNNCLSLLKSRAMLDALVASFKDALFALENTDYVDQMIVDNNQELLKVQRKVNKELEGAKKSLELVDKTFQKMVAYEHESMLCEDYNSTLLRSVSFEKDLDIILLTHRRSISSFSLSEWQAFNTNFLNKPFNKSMLDLMRTIMVVINFTPPKIVKGDKITGVIKMDDEMVARCTTTLMVKSSDFARKVSNVAYAALGSTQTHALRIMNSLLNTSLLEYISHDSLSPQERLRLFKKHLDADKSGNSIFDCLRRYLLLLDIGVSASQESSGTQERLDDLTNQINNIKAENLLYKQGMANVLKGQIDVMIGQISILDSTLQSNRRKLETIERNYQRHDAVREALIGAQLFAKAEINKLDFILQHLVGDICIAVTILLRAGIFPDSLRQECLECVRKDAKSHGVKNSESPMIFGCLLERLQIRQWVNHGEQCLPKDVPSINAMSLLYLSPYYTLVVDPDGCSVPAIASSIPERYDLISVTAQRFSLVALQTWVENVLGSDINDNGLFLLVTDVQAGVSDDLLCLLTSKLDDNKEENPISSELRGNLLNVDTSRILDLSNAKNLRKAYIQLPKRFRLVMVTSKVPTQSTQGKSYPFPSSCMEYVHVIHWSVEDNASFYIDKQPIQNALEKNTATDHTFIEKMAYKASRYLSPSFLEDLQARNYGILFNHISINKTEKEIQNVVFQWLKDESEKNFEELKIEGLIEQQNVSLSILSSEYIVDLLVKSTQKRKDLLKAIRKDTEFYSEGVTYLSSIEGVFTMSSDFLRICHKLLPNDCFAPFSLSTHSLVTNLVPDVMVQQTVIKLATNFPNSLYRAYRLWTAIASVQRLFRSKKSPFYKDTRQISREISIQQINNSQAIAKAFTLPDEHAGSIGLLPLIRFKALQVLNYKLLPLRSLFLREVLKFVQHNIRPGMESVTKLLLLIAAWAQNNDSIPEAELKSLFHFLSDAQSVPFKRFCHFYQLPKADSSLRCYLFDNSIDKGINFSLPGIKEEGEEDANANNDKEASVAHLSSTSLPHSETDEFMQQLPNTATMRQRITAFAFAKPRVSNIQNILSKEVKSTTEERDLHRLERLLDSGPGLPDCLWVNTRSRQWAISTKQDDGKTKNLYSEKTSSNSGRYLLRDELSFLYERMRGNKPLAKRGDSFEIEWLKLKGFKAFAINNIAALEAFGASSQTITEIGNSRQTLLMKMPAGYSMKKPVRRVRESLHRKYSFGPKTNTYNTRRGSMLLKKTTIHSMTSTAVTSTAVGSPVGAAAERGQAERLSTDRRTSSAGQQKGVPDKASLIIQDISADALQARKSTILKRISVRSSKLFSRPSSTIKPTFSSPSPSSSSSPAAPPLSAQTPGKLHSQSSISSIGKITQGAGDFIELIDNPQGYINLMILESHPDLSPVFRGITAGIGRNLLDFQEWKESIIQLEGMDARNLDESELLELIRLIQPPRCLDVSDEASLLAAGGSTSTGNNGDSSEGLWAKGYELTITQTLILCEALWPGSSENLTEFIYALIVAYLKKEGTIVSYPDELAIDDDDDDEEDADDEEDEDDDDGEKETDDGDRLGRNDSRGKAATFSSSRSVSLSRINEVEEGEDAPNLHINGSNGEGKNSVTIGKSRETVPGGEGDTTRAGGNNRSTFALSINTFVQSTMQGLRQESIHFINCWSKFERLFSGRLSIQPPELICTSSTSTHSTSSSSYAISLRDFSNWEGVIQDAFLEYTEVSKFVFMKQLRDTMLGNQSTYFLSPSENGTQAAIFSERARNYALQGGKHIPITHCNIHYILDDTMALSDKREAKSMLIDFIKGIKSSLSHSNARKAILEMLDIHSSTGNAILYSILLTPQAGITRIADNKSLINISKDLLLVENLMLTGKANEALSLMASSARAAASSTTSTVNNVVGGKGWKDTFPLIISSTYSFSRQRSLHPPTLLGEVKFTWLPRFFAPDVSRNFSKVLRIQDGTIQSLPSLPESCGILFEELDAALMRIMMCTRSISMTRISPDTRSRIQQSTKLQTRVTAGLLTLWQVSQYMYCHECDDSDSADIDAHWSACMNSLSLWQLTRLMLKTIDFLDNDWSSVTNSLKSVEELLSHEKFMKGIKVLVESFSRVDTNFYTSVIGTSAVGVGSQAASASVSVSVPGTPMTAGAGHLRREASMRNRQQQSSNNSNSNAETDSSDINSSLNTLEKSKSDILRIEKQILSCVLTDKSVVGVGEATQQGGTRGGGGGGGSIRDIVGIAGKIGLKSGVNPKLASFTEVVDAVLENSSTSMTVRSYKQVKKLLKKADEAKLIFTEELSHASRFSLLDATGMKSLDRVSYEWNRAMAVGTGVTGVAGGYIHPEHKNSADTTSSTAVKSRLHAEFIDRVHIVIGRYLAEIIWKRVGKKNTRRGSVKMDEKANINMAAMSLMNARNNSVRMDIASILADSPDSPSVSTPVPGSAGKSAATFFPSGGETTGAIPSSHSRPADGPDFIWQKNKKPVLKRQVDVMFGRLLPAEFMQVMVDWTYDGSAAPKATKELRKRLLKLIKRLSERVKSGTFKMPSL